MIRLRIRFQGGKLWRKDGRFGVYLFVVVPLCFYLEVSLCTEIHHLRLCFGKNLDYLQLPCERTKRMRKNFEINPFPVWHTRLRLLILPADRGAEPTSALKTSIAALIPAFKSPCSHWWCQILSKHSSVFRSQVEFAIPWVEGKSSSFLPLKNLGNSAGKVSRINLQPCRVLWVIVESWVSRQIGCQSCSSPYQRHSLLKSHLCYSRENHPVAKGTPPFSSQGSDLLLILGNYPLIFLKNASIYHKDWHQHRLQTWLQWQALIS